MSNALCSRFRSFTTHNMPVRSGGRRGTLMVSSIGLRVAVALFASNTGGHRHAARDAPPGPRRPGPPSFAACAPGGCSYAARTVVARCYRRLHEWPVAPSRPGRMGPIRARARARGRGGSTATTAHSGRNRHARRRCVVATRRGLLGTHVASEDGHLAARPAARRHRSGTRDRGGPRRWWCDHRGPTARVDDCTAPTARRGRRDPQAHHDLAT